MRFPIFLWLLVACLSSAQAQVPPPADQALFVDSDLAAWVHFPGDEQQMKSRVDSHLQHFPGNSRAWSARAFLHALQGDSESALADLQRARGLADQNPLLLRETLWSEGWIRLHLGHIPEARDAWSEAVQRHGGEPFWLPYSFAVLAELGGERHTALAWYSVAARGMPERWASDEGVRNYVRHWRDAERVAMIGLYRAWAAAASKP